MTDEDKNELFKHSETLKNNALSLFEGKGDAGAVYGLVLAASKIIKEGKKSYNEAVFGALTILMHLDECSGCEEHKEAASE